MSHKFSPENPFKSQRAQPETAVDVPESMGLRMEYFFSTPGEHPFEQLEWEMRSAKITDDSGQAIFEQANTFTAMSNPVNGSIL